MIRDEANIAGVLLEYEQTDELDAATENEVNRRVKSLQTRTREAGRLATRLAPAPLSDEELLGAQLVFISRAGRC